MPAVRLIKHEAVPKCGSFEVRFSDGRPSHYFYWDDIPGRRRCGGGATSPKSRLMTTHLGHSDRIGYRSVISGSRDISLLFTPGGGGLGQIVAGAYVAP
jgi:hypothetical protein